MGKVVLKAGQLQVLARSAEWSRTLMKLSGDEARERIDRDVAKATVPGARFGRDGPYKSTGARGFSV